MRKCFGGLSECPLYCFTIEGPTSLKSAFIGASHSSMKRSLFALNQSRSCRAPSSLKKRSPAFEKPSKGMAPSISASGLPRRGVTRPQLADARIGAARLQRKRNEPVERIRAAGGRIDVHDQQV